MWGQMHLDQDPHSPVWLTARAVCEISLVTEAGQVKTQ